MRVRVYVVSERDQLGGAVDLIDKRAETLVLDSGEKNLASYKEIFLDEEPKILAIDPGVIEWKFPKKVLEKIPNLQGICTKSAWAYYIDINHCREKKIKVTNCPGANSQSVAEYGILIMIGLTRKLSLQIKDGFRVFYDKTHEGVEVFGKTIGIIGLGRVGSRIAKIGQGIGMNVVYWSQKTRDQSYKYLNLDVLLKESDFVFNCLETCEGTKNLLNKQKLSLMKKDAYFISVLGGMGWEVEDDDYLLKMVKTGKLAGLGVENEHNHGFSCPKNVSGNVFIPGSYAWFTREAQEMTNKMWAEGINGIISGNFIHTVT